MFQLLRGNQIAKLFLMLSLLIASSGVAHALTLSGGALTGGSVGTTYSKTIAASGGTAPYTYSVASGSLPAGLSLNSTSGVVSGTPTTVGSASFSITALDSTAASATAAYTLNISASSLSLVSNSLAYAKASSPNTYAYSDTGVDPVSPDRRRLGLGTEPDELARRTELQA